MVGHVSRIVGMAVAQLWDHGLERVQHVEISSGIEISGGQSCGGVKDQQMAYPRTGFSALLLDQIRDVEDFSLLMGFD